MRHFILPTDGFIGYLWDDSFKLGHRHQGIDIFGGAEPGVIPVYSASDGFPYQAGRLEIQPDHSGTG